MKKILKINLGGEYVDCNGLPRRTKLFEEVEIHKYDNTLDELTIGDKIKDEDRLIQITHRIYDYENNICILFDSGNHWIKIDVEDALSHDVLLDYLTEQFEK